MNYQFERCKDRGKIVQIGIDTELVENGLISEDILEDFDFAMKARERADYSYIYDKSLAHDMLESTKKLISEVENLL